MTFTHHARARFARRFPGRDMEKVFESVSYRLTRNEMKLMRKFCPSHAHLISRANPEYWYCKTRDGIVFVMARPARVVTVFKLRRKES